MIVHKRSGSLPVICYYIGVVLIGLGLLQLVPLITSLCYGEWNTLVDFVFSACVTLAVGLTMMGMCGQCRRKRLGWAEGMSVAAGSWLIGMLFCAIPYQLSGHCGSYLDACYDVMSGLTTTGLVLMQDIDHASNGLNMWRHLLTFLGGQGMVVLVLTALVKGTDGAYRMYVGEGKDEKLLPSVAGTSRYIWYVSLVYLAIGTLAQWAVGMAIGLPWDRALLHGMWIFMSAWSTGGFGPMSQNILYYHSMGYELVTIVFFVIGSFNFALHYAVFNRRRRELLRNIETVTFAITVTVFTLIATLGLMQNNVYPGVLAMFRKGFYNLISGHTTTGFMTVYAKQFYHEWGDIALFAMIAVMLLGGSACSTAGGFKAIRVGILFKAIRREVRRVIYPENTVSAETYHHIGAVALEDQNIKSALIIILLYILTFAAGTLASMLCGYPFALAAFETASATGNVGLSAGLTTPAMPAALKVVYLVILWLSRLEFMSALALGAYLSMKVKNACKKD